MEVLKTDSCLVSLKGGGESVGTFTWLKLGTQRRCFIIYAKAISGSSSEAGLRQEQLGVANVKVKNGLRSQRARRKVKSNL